MTNMLNGTTAIVTGASSGIGSATAEALADRGATVALLARRKDRLEDLARKLNAKRERAAHIFELDVSDHASIKGVLDRIGDELGTIDILVNCAGIGTWGPAMEANLGDWQAMVDVNLTGVMATIHAALPYLVGSAQAARGVADVVTVSSIAGRKVPGPVGSVYAATKHGVGAFCEGLRQEFAKQHVRVGLVEPGIVETEMTTSGAQYAPDARNPSGLGVLKPEDVADAIVYMVSRPAHSAINEILIRPTEQVV